MLERGGVIAGIVPGRLPQAKRGGNLACVQR
jgi:hypothetical protein